MEKTLQYHQLSRELQERVQADRAAHWENPWRFPDEGAQRRDMDRDKASLWRPAFVRDSEKIMHLPLYNRYADKTQVFSFSRTTTSPGGPSMCSWCPASPETSGRCWA